MKQTKSTRTLLLECIIVTGLCVTFYFFISAIVLFLVNFLSEESFEISKVNHLIFEKSNLMKCLQGASSLLIFMLPAFWLYYKNRESFGKIGFLKVTPELLLMVVLLYIFSLPLIQYTSLLNQAIHFPAKFTHIEHYLRTSEHQTEMATLALLKGTHLLDLLLNIIVIAALPALCEEVFFRGVLQKMFKKMFKNTHLAIWFTAFLFSFLHFQFFGIIPRFLIGLILGYLYAYSRNIWYNILYHFVNNGVVVCFFFYLNIKNLPMEKANEDWGFPLFSYGIFLMLTLTTLYWFCKKQSFTSLVQE